MGGVLVLLTFLTLGRLRKIPNHDMQHDCIEGHGVGERRGRKRETNRQSETWGGEGELCHARLLTVSHHASLALTWPLPLVPWFPGSLVPSHTTGYLLADVFHA